GRVTCAQGDPRPRGGSRRRTSAASRGTLGRDAAAKATLRVARGVPDLTWAGLTWAGLTWAGHTRGVRIFLPATAATLRRLPGAPIEARVAFAATPELARVLAGEDDEAVEFSAFLAAADTSVELLAEAQAA